MTSVAEMCVWLAHLIYVSGTIFIHCYNVMGYLGSYKRVSYKIACYRPIVRRLTRDFNISITSTIVTTARKSMVKILRVGLSIIVSIQ